MKRGTVLVCLMFVVISLAGCGEKERIEGTVQDVFGNSLKGVSVKIEKSTFMSITDHSWNYSLDYAPGSIKLIFSKEGYTTINIDLNIHQKSYFPAELIVLYPIPKESGIFYIDKEKKGLVKLETNCKVEETKTDNQGFSLTMNYRYFVRCSSQAMTIKPGKFTFIDRMPMPINISSVKENGLIYEGNLNMFERHDKYSGFIKGSSSLIGNEKLLIRSFELSSGSYAFVEMLKNDMIGLIPNKGSAAIGFKVEGVSANTAPSPLLGPHADGEIAAPLTSRNTTPDPPLLPQDTTHLKFQIMEKKAAEKFCEECHNPQGKKPLSQKHPPKYRCLFCHKQSQQ